MTDRKPPQDSPIKENWKIREERLNGFGLQLYTYAVAGNIQGIIELKTTHSSSEWLDILGHHHTVNEKFDTFAHHVGSLEDKTPFLASVTDIDLRARESHFSESSSFIGIAIRSYDHNIVEALFDGLSSKTTQKLITSYDFRSAVVSSNEEHHQRWIGDIYNFFLNPLTEDEKFELLIDLDFRVRSPYKYNDTFSIDILTFSIFKNWNYLAQILKNNLSEERFLDLLKHEKDHINPNAIRAACMKQNIEGLSIIKANMTDEKWLEVADKYDLDVIARTSNTEMFKLYKGNITGDKWFEFISGMFGTEVLKIASINNNAEIIDLLHDDLTQRQWIQISSKTFNFKHAQYLSTDVTALFYAIHNDNRHKSKKYDIPTIRALHKGIPPTRWSKLIIPTYKRSRLHYRTDCVTPITDLDPNSENIVEAIAALREGLSASQWTFLLTKHYLGKTLLHIILNNENGDRYSPDEKKQEKRITQNQAIAVTLFGLNENQLIRVLLSRTYGGDRKTVLHYDSVDFIHQIYPRLSTKSIYKLATLSDEKGKTILDTLLASGVSEHTSEILKYLYDEPESKALRFLAKHSDPIIASLTQLQKLYNIFHMSRVDCYKVLDLVAKFDTLASTLILSGNKRDLAIQIGLFDMFFDDKREILGNILQSCVPLNMTTSEFPSTIDILTGYLDSIQSFERLNRKEYSIEEMEIVEFYMLKKRVDSLHEIIQLIDSLSSDNKATVLRSFYHFGSKKLNSILDYDFEWSHFENRESDIVDLFLQLEHLPIHFIDKSHQLKPG